MSVLIESAGSHFFDLGHIRREGGEELVEQTLKKAGLPTNVLWRVQVQKKLLCNAETPAIRVIDEPKKWAIYLRIKPGDNNTCHYCTLIMPDGFQGPEVYEQLKEAALTFDRNWRHKAAEKAPVAEPVAALAGASADADDHSICEVVNVPEREIFVPPVPIQPLLPEVRAVIPPPNGMNPSPINGAPAPAKEKIPVKGCMADRERTKELLLAVYAINEDYGSCPQDRWVELLSERMGWESANRYEIGGVLTSLVRKDLIVKRVRGSKPFGYELTEEGLELIADRLKSRPGTSTAAGPGAPAVDPAAVIRSFGPVAKQFLDAYARLAEVDKREAELVEELDMIRGERDELCRFLADPQVKGVLASLAQVAK